MEYLISIGILLSLYAILASSLNLVMGHGGLISLSHAAFYGLGAYAAALGSTQLSMPFPLTLIFASIVTAAFVALLAPPLLKLEGDYFILGSLGIQIIIIDILYNVDAFGGPNGIPNISRPNILGLSVNTNLRYLLLYAAISAAWIAFIAYVSKSPFGKVLNSTRDDAIAAVGLGKRVQYTQVIAYAISAAGAACAGAMYAHYVTFIDPLGFTFRESIYIISMVVVGGVATIRGPLLGAFLLVIAPETLRFVGVSSSVDGSIRELLYGVLLMTFALMRPNGIAGKRIF